MQICTMMAIVWKQEIIAYIKLQGNTENYDP